MPEALTIVVSDVHLDTWEEDVPALAGQRRQNLLEFFDWVIQLRPRQLVIVGDLLDVPERRGEPLLPKYADVAGRMREVVRAGVRLCYVVGNHDAGALGLRVALSEPFVRVDYPLTWIVSGGCNILCEHGHLHDPWLWDYVRQLAQQMWVADPDAPAPWRLQPAIRRVEIQEQSSGEPPAAEAARLLPRLVQAERLHRFLDQGGLQRLERAVARELAEDYSDVGDLHHLPAAAVDPQQLLAALRQATDPAARRPLIEQLVQWVYSRPHWRQAALARAREMKSKTGQTFHAVIMGHTHYPDAPDSLPIAYVNCGSWRREDGHLVSVVEGHLHLHRRQWNDPWPDL